MHLAYPLPWWLALLLAAAIGAAAFFEYRRPLSPLTRQQRGSLVAMRVIVLAAVVLFSDGGDTSWAGRTGRAGEAGRAGVSGGSGGSGGDAGAPVFAVGIGSPD